MPQSVPLKPREQYRLIGKAATRRTDAPAKVDGSAKLGMDVVVPGMRFASVARSPVLGGTARSFDAAKAKRVAGVIDVVRIPQGVAVIATNTWAAFKGRGALEVSWDDGPNAHLATEAMFADSERLARDRVRLRRSYGGGSYDVSSVDREALQGVPSESGDSSG